MALCQLAAQLRHALWKPRQELWLVATYAKVRGIATSRGMPRNSSHGKRYFHARYLALLVKSCVVPRVDLRGATHESAWCHAWKCVVPRMEVRGATRGFAWCHACMDTRGKMKL